MRIGVDCHADRKKDLGVKISPNPWNSVVVKVTQGDYPKVTLFLTHDHFETLKKEINAFDVTTVKNAT